MPDWAAVGKNSSIGTQNDLFLNHAENHIPGVTSNPQIGKVRDFTLVYVQGIFAPGTLTDEQLERINADLAALPAH
jgi:hypothetical protein